MKQTAVSWLVEQLKGKSQSITWNEIFDKAKEMEKEQIIDFAYYFRHEEVTKKELEQYYSKTYENKENI